MAKTKSIRLVREAANITLTRKQIDKIGEASYDVEYALKSIVAFVEKFDETPFENEYGIEVAVAIRALCLLAGKANTTMFTIVCDPVEAARLEVAHA